MPNSALFGLGGTETALIRTTNLPPVGSWTMMCWFRQKAIGSGFQALFSLGNTTPTGLFCEYGQALGSAKLTVQTSAQTGLGVTTLVDGVWYHAALVIRGTSGALAASYLNGVQERTATASAETNVRIRIGENNSGDAPLNSVALSAIKIWNRALGLDELKREMMYAMPVSYDGLNSAYPLGNEWDIMSSGLVIPKSARSRWGDVTGKTGNEWSETNGSSISITAGPPIQFAPASPSRHARIQKPVVGGYALLLMADLDGIGGSGRMMRRGLS